MHVYVDDLVIVSQDFDWFKKLVLAKDLMDDIGPLKHLLGMKIEKMGSSIKLSQDVYTSGILSSYGMLQACTASTPLVPGVCLLLATPEDYQAFLRLGVNYWRAIGLLNYLAVSVRPNISYAMSQLSQYLEEPSTQHWDACIHLLCYLSGSPSQGLALGASILPLKLFMDANHANEILNSHSNHRYLALLGTSLISWKLKKHTLVSSSFMEAKYTGLYEAGQEAVWLVCLKESLNIQHSGPVSILCDKQAAIQLAKKINFKIVPSISAFTFTGYVRKSSLVKSTPSMS